MFPNGTVSRKLLHKTNPQKATGSDCIPARILKSCASELAPILTIVFNRSLQKGSVSEDWRHAYVTAIFKKGTRHDSVNYRLVSLTSLCCKKANVIVSNTLNHLERHKILNDCQHGFRAKRSCEPRYSPNIINWLHHWTRRPKLNDHT